MPNRLASATSPYLLPHKDNPVDWREWSGHVFSEARERDIPILLSVRYAACHWCHVIAHESFEDDDTAAVMNEKFVNSRVDREEPRRRLDLYGSGVGDDRPGRLGSPCSPVRSGHRRL